MVCHSIEAKTRKCIKGYGFLLLLLKNKIGYFRNCDKKVARKRTEATGEIIGNKILDKTLKPKAPSNENSNNYSTIKLRQIKTSIIKWNSIKYLNY